MTQFPANPTEPAPEPQFISAEFPEKLQFLFEPHPFKVLFGGRSGAKSWGIARALLMLGTQKPLRILCARETQKSIGESVHKLLSDQIKELGLEDFYEIQKSTIIGLNGTSFIFAGIKQNVNNLKSYEGCDICWVEEAQSVSRHSWKVLIPTIRKEGSEIWISFNPDLDTDATYELFVLKPPPGAVVVKVSYRDNPFCPEKAKKDALHCQLTTPDDYEHIWEGSCVSALAGAIYANELRAVDRENRICRVPYDATRPVHTFWDLGWGDNTAVWFAQVYPFEYRLIDYVQGCQQPLVYYLKELQQRPYLYGTDYLPHDAQAHTLGTGKSVQELMRAAGRRVEIVPNLSVSDGINAARTIFPQCWFDSNNCKDGLQALRRYRYKANKELGTQSRLPLHDAASDPADAFRMFAVGVRRPAPKAPPRPPPTPTRAGGDRSWMT